MSGTASEILPQRNGGHLRRSSWSQSYAALRIPKESTGERAVGIRQSDHHETFARPDVERLLFHLPPAIGRGRNGEFL